MLIDTRFKQETFLPFSIADGIVVGGGDIYKQRACYWGIYVTKSKMCKWRMATMRPTGNKKGFIILLDFTPALD